MGVYKAPAEFAGALAVYGGATITTSRVRQEVTIAKETTLSLGAWDARAQGLGGWTLDVHHGDDPNSRTLYFGNGERRRDRSEAGIVTTVSNTTPRAVGYFRGGARAEDSTSRTSCRASFSSPRPLGGGHDGGGRRHVRLRW